jgi:hypothetical protein
MNLKTFGRYRPHPGLRGSPTLPCSSSESGPVGCLSLGTSDNLSYILKLVTTFLFRTSKLSHLIVYIQNMPFTLQNAHIPSLVLCTVTFTFRKFVPYALIAYHHYRSVGLSQVASNSALAASLLYKRISTSSEEH